MHHAHFTTGTNAQFNRILLLRRRTRLLYERKGYDKTLRKIVNTHARSLWAIHEKNERYDARLLVSPITLRGTSHVFSALMSPHLHPSNRSQLLLSLQLRKMEHGST